MRTYETAAVKVAVKRSIKAGNIEAGYQYLHKWHRRHQYAEMSEVLKCFKKWVRRYQNLRRNMA
ncbi:MAG: hypothetical protein ACLSX0_01315 [Anaerostipes caccae]|jgi:hypothetical protein